ncbi:SRPBCC domain-containing protein [Pseudonocardia petroleophila]|uniref:SRPBCC domain-containing protein n=1 Tax=Pseudonocardia petroleophila TaxID=37331 RepID=A0A7G7MI98_9PSEU|nr:SRPBCC domain-containing protein [Pseudonocardia petroleophila]QNG52509.1 SRPBCC domain-containing protein [Pseudonocardia petroleophila]
MTTTQKIQIAIRADAAQVFDALTDGKQTPAYYYGFEAEFDLAAGRPYRYVAGGADMITGTVLAVDPGRSLRTTFRGAWTPDVAALPESTVTCTLSDPPMPTPGVTVLTLEHEGLPDGAAAAGIEIGWVLILSGLKTLLETERPMVDAPH